MRRGPTEGEEQEEEDALLSFLIAASFSLHRDVKASQLVFLGFFF